MGVKIIPIYQETQAEETAARENKASCKNKKNNIITVNVNEKWCAPDKNNNKQNPFVHKKDAYDDIANKYLQKIEYQKIN